MELAHVEYTPGPPENWMPPQMGQDDLFEALEVELDHNNLIKNISPMQWNLKVQLTSIYFLEMALQVYIKLSQITYLKACWLEFRNRSP